MLTLKITILLPFAFMGSVTLLAQQENSRNPGAKKGTTELFRPRVSIHDLPKGYYTKMLSTKVQEYKDRMVANVKKHQKMAKAMEKPQYSDPMYFGHKRRPKKRALNKRKLCAECGIVH